MEEGKQIWVAGSVDELLALLFTCGPCYVVLSHRRDGIFTTDSYIKLSRPGIYSWAMSRKLMRWDAESPGIPQYCIAEKGISYLTDKYPGADLNQLYITLRI